MKSDIKPIKFLGLFFLIFISISVKSQSFNNEKTLFWEVSGNGLEQTSYIFGTMHLMPKKDYVEYKVVKEKLKQADQLVLEMIVDMPLKEQLNMARMMMLPNGTTISNYVDERTFSAFKSLLVDSIGISEKKFETYQKFKPFALYSLVLKEIVGKIEIYEINFSKYAAKQKKEVVGLETFEFQLAIFDSISVEDQIEMFFGSDIMSEMTDLIEIYKDQDIEKMAAMVGEDSSYSNLENQLLLDRNHDWIGKLEKLMADKSVFVAVGAAHLGGSEGVLNLLKLEGYEVRPIFLK